MKHKPCTKETNHQSLLEVFLLGAEARSTANYISAKLPLMVQRFFNQTYFQVKHFVLKNYYTYKLYTVEEHTVSHKTLSNASDFLEGI